MKKLNTFNFNEMKYMFIFNYFEVPLSFISELNNEYFFFYFIDTNIFFIKKLLSRDVEMIFSNLDTKDILQDFYLSGSLKVIDFTDDINQIYELGSYESLIGESLENFFPEEGFKFDFDYITNKKIEIELNDLKDIFHYIFDLESITYKLVDQYNSHSVSTNIVQKVISFVSEYFKHEKNEISSKDKFNQQELMLTPFSVGSFEINFSIESKQKISFFEEDISFDYMVNYLRAISEYDPAYLIDKEIVNDDYLFEETRNFIETLRKDNLDVKVNNKNTELVGIVSNETLMKKMNLIDNHLIEEKKLKTELNIQDFTAEILSWSKLRNSIKIKDSNGIRYTAKFKTELFQEIKNNSLDMRSSKPIEGKIQIESFFDEDGQLIEDKTKYTIISFNQK